MTSNIGVDDVHRFSDRVGFANRHTGDVDANSVAFTMKEAVKKTFRPEFVNRIDEVIQFRPLTIDDCERIAQLQLSEMAGYLGRTGVQLRFAASLARHIARLGWSAEYGARELRRHIRDEVEAPLAERLMDGIYKPGDTVSISVRAKGKVTMTAVRSRRSPAALPETGAV